jgi:hypothetical protein
MYHAEEVYEGTCIQDFMHENCMLVDALRLRTSCMEFVWDCTWAAGQLEERLLVFSFLVGPMTCLSGKGKNKKFGSSI